MRDLVVLVADKNMQFALQGALGRPQALGMRPLTYEFRSHMGRDGGVRTTSRFYLSEDQLHFSDKCRLILLKVWPCSFNKIKPQSGHAPTASLKTCQEAC